MISLVKRCHMMYTSKITNVVNEGEGWTEDFDSRKMEQFVCIPSCTGKAFRISTINLKIFNFFSKSFSKHKQANISVKSRRFGIIMTTFPRQNE